MTNIIGQHLKSDFRVFVSLPVCFKNTDLFIVFPLGSRSRRPGGLSAPVLHRDAALPVGQPPVGVGLLPAAALDLLARTAAVLRPLSPVGHHDGGRHVLPGWRRRR